MQKSLTMGVILQTPENVENQKAKLYSVFVANSQEMGIFWGTNPILRTPSLGVHYAPGPCFGCTVLQEHIRILLQIIHTPGVYAPGASTPGTVAPGA